ncbi:DUF3560 domain-containing protein [Pseudoclavibacter sp. RFBA6]|uniref:DUF3560 domain-containing protein n=1 Tax=Pseudoclavibacter sp. RFBA6 TaxID=2080573 RepID=UPI000CE7FDE2|nr:DUF3560 domain-containing protein [Pseudoclavibacter sp. RFBA6]PPG43750.1 hypothetical protein C5C17_00505 [Pseudoclavibacter sp. RFBA6]
MLTITHNHEEGTLIEGTSKGDGTSDILKRSGWRWGSSISAWYVPFSRDRRPKLHVINRTIEALTAAGFTVTAELDETTRTTAEVEAGKIERQANRVDALEAKAERKSAAAEVAEARRQADLARLPDNGQPILVGHHSERGHRRAIDKAWSSLGKSVEADREADEAARKAVTASHTTGARYSPITVANRIKKLTADKRRYERQLTEKFWDKSTPSVYRAPNETESEARARRLNPYIEECADQLAFWEGVRAQQIADGTATNYSQANVKKGDRVKIRGTWYTVARANAKTVAVETQYTWTGKSPWHEVQRHVTAEAYAEALAQRDAAAVGAH